MEKIRGASTPSFPLPRLSEEADGCRSISATTSWTSAASRFLSSTELKIVGTLSKTESGAGRREIAQHNAYLLHHPVLPAHPLSGTEPTAALEVGGEAPSGHPRPQGPSAGSAPRARDLRVPPLPGSGGALTAPALPWISSPTWGESGGHSVSLSLPPLTSAAWRRIARVMSTITAESQGHLFVFHRVDHLCIFMLGARECKLNPGAFNLYSVLSTIFPEMISPIEPYVTHQRDSLSLARPCAGPSTPCSPVPCLQTEGRRRALIKMHRAPHPPKRFIPSEGWASGSGATPVPNWQGSRRPEANRDAPPAAHSTALRLGGGAPAAHGTFDRRVGEERLSRRRAYGTGNRVAGASRGTPTGVFRPRGSESPQPRRPQPHRLAAEHAQCRPRRPSERVAGNDAAEGAGGRGATLRTSGAGRARGGVPGCGGATCERRNQVERGAGGA